jgi:hypothetical protein
MQKMKTFITFLVATFTALAASAQLFQPLGLGFKGGEWLGDYNFHKMHIEGERLYVCTNNGLYAKDLTDDGSAWQLVGFEGIPLIDYARRGSDILVLRYNKGEGFLLLSHDDGKTYEDVTPEIFTARKDATFLHLVQHPTEPNTLLTSSAYYGIFCTKDFGQTWEEVNNWALRIGLGYHPAQPSIIYNTGSSYIFGGHLNISYDEGKNWTGYDTHASGDKSLGYPGDNQVYHPAFHPVNPDRWIAGGNDCVYLTENNGLTWNCHIFDNRREGIWMQAAYDEEHPDTVYITGYNIKTMCSTDGGHSWHNPTQMGGAERTNDLLQYHDRLLIYAESDVYSVNKAELVAECITEIRPIVSEEQKTKIYDLSGRRVEKPGKGIYIRNGKKIIY